MIGPMPTGGPVVRCRKLTRDVRHLHVGDQVYVDFAGCAWDHKALLERAEVIVVRYPETRVTDGGLERLLDAAELLEGHGA